MTVSAQTPFPWFPDADGHGLDDGYIYFGVVHLNPITNPVDVFFDAAMLIPATQPLRTSAGFIIDGTGTYQNVYTAADFSIQVSDRTNSVLYSLPSYGLRIFASAITFDSVIVGTSIVPDAAGGAFDGTVLLPWLSQVTRDLQAKTATVYNQAHPATAADMAAFTQRGKVLLSGSQLDADATPTWVNSLNLNAAASSRVSIGRYRIIPTVALPSTYQPLITLTTDPGNFSIDICTAGKNTTQFDIFIRIATALVDWPFDFVVFGNPAVADPIS